MVFHSSIIITSSNDLRRLLIHNLTKYHGPCYLQPGILVSFGVLDSQPLLVPSLGKIIPPTSQTLFGWWLPTKIINLHQNLMIFPISLIRKNFIRSFRIYLRFSRTKSIFFSKISSLSTFFDL